MSPHFRSDHDAVTMGPFVVVLIAIAIYCSETCCDTFPTVIPEPEDVEHVERNDGDAASKKGSLGEIFWKTFGLPRRKSKMEEPRSPANGTSDETSKRKSRILGSLAFLAGLSFGGLATAASSTVKSFAKMPQASFTVNLGQPKVPSPYFAAYYNPYSLLPYPFLYTGSPFGLVPMIDAAKPQTMSHNDLTPQVISLFDNRQSNDLTENDEEYADGGKKHDNVKSGVNGAEAADRRGVESLRAEANRHAEEKKVMRGCKESQRKHGKGSARERENLQVDADYSRVASDFQIANATDPGANQTVTTNPTMITTSPSNIVPTGGYPHHYYHHRNYTNIPPVSYYGGYPQDISHVDLTRDPGAQQYYDQGQVNHNLPYENPANFYHDSKYNVHSNPHVNPYYSGPFRPDQISEYVGADYVPQMYPSEYQPPYSNGFRPIK